jgi:hypothetical protein
MLSEVSERILSPIVLYVHAVSFKYQRFLRCTSSKRAYAEYVFQTMSYVSETVPTLLGVAEMNPMHPATAWLYQHAAEERGHDSIFRSDLNNLGIDNSEFDISPPVQELISIERGIRNSADPVSTIFGDIAVMECFPPSKAGIDQLIFHFGVSSEAAQGFFLHSSADVNHRDEALRWMATPFIDKAVMFNRAMLVCRLFCRHWDWMTSRYAIERSVEK